MRDNDSGSERQSGWQPPEYVSPWASSSGAGGASDSDGAPGSGDTIAFGPGSGQDPAAGYQQPGHQQPGYQPAYQQPAYQQPWFGHTVFGQTGFGQPGYGQPGYGAGAPGAPGQGGYGAWTGGPGDQWGGYGTPPPPQGSRFGRFLAYVAVAALAAGVGAGAAIALNHTAGSAPAASSAPASPNPGSGIGQNPFNGGNQGNGFGTAPSGGQNGTGGTSSGSGSLNAQALATRVDPGLVDVDAQLGYTGNIAEGTGMIISPSGLVLTNNHVIDQATSVTATLVVTGKTYTAHVVGYDSTDDVALLQLQGTSGLKTVSLGNSSQVKVGQAVLALGNAGGRGGLPSTAQGVINGLNRTIQASDNGANTYETLHGMLETNAPIQEGDSGGPLVNSAGNVIGMDTAANTAGGIVSNYQQLATIGFAIPINHAISIADQIAAGHASATVHIGLGGFIGIDVGDPSSGCPGGFGVSSPVSSGALVCEVIPGTPAASAGLAAGDAITSVNGQPVASSGALTKVLAGDHPGDQLSIGYVDANGIRHTTTVTLTEMAR